MPKRRIKRRKTPSAPTLLRRYDQKLRVLSTKLIVVENSLMASLELLASGMKILEDQIRRARLLERRRQRGETGREGRIYPLDARE